MRYVLQCANSQNPNGSPPLYADKAAIQAQCIWAEDVMLLPAMSAEQGLLLAAICVTVWGTGWVIGLAAKIISK